MNSMWQLLSSSSLEPTALNRLLFSLQNTCMFDQHYYPHIRIRGARRSPVILCLAKNLHTKVIRILNCHSSAWEVLVGSSAEFSMHSKKLQFLLKHSCISKSAVNNSLAAHHPLPKITSRALALNKSEVSRPIYVLDMMWEGEKAFGNPSKLKSHLLSLKTHSSEMAFLICCKTNPQIFICHHRSHLWNTKHIFMYILGHKPA